MQFKCRPAGTDKSHVEAKRLLALRESAYGALTSGQREAFLRRPGARALCQFPEPAVLAALGRTNELTRLAEVVASEAWWYEGRPCEQDELARCARCKPHPYPAAVVMTKGWSDAFHQSEHCAWLLQGQEAVLARGGGTAPVERVAVQVALGSGRSPCPWCSPARKGHG